ncbi:MAG: isoprenylcysteine carboxylmethyltransferase family protein [Methanothrix sp.]|nr:isoprenylcysteine carboxylmethyltransferase family protein [Methanothrix sp.]
MIPVILFALAGTLHYWQGWLYWVVLLMPMLYAVSYFLKTDPELLERRMKFQEKEPEQRTIILLGNAVFIAGFLAIAIDLRLHGLNQVSSSMVLAADAGVLLGYGLILWVFKGNSYASRTIEVVEGQKVITAGPYSIIRHPMYLGFLVMYLLTPIALGSWWAVPFFSLYIPLLVWRIYGEEKVLLRDLSGYYEYCQERRYRLLPLVW